MLDLDTLKPNTICESRDGRDWEYIGKAAVRDVYIFYGLNEGFFKSTDKHGQVGPNYNNIVSIKPSAPPENYVNVCGSCGTRGNAVHAPGCHYFRSSSELAAKREFMAQKAKELRLIGDLALDNGTDGRVSVSHAEHVISKFAKIMAEVVERL